AIPQRFDHTGLRGARPPRAIPGALLDGDVHPVVGTRQCPQLGGGSFGIRLTAILLSGCRVPARRQHCVGRPDLTRPPLLPPLLPPPPPPARRPIRFAV